jgi:hypothetical protein
MLGLVITRIEPDNRRVTIVLRCEGPKTVLTICTVRMNNGGCSRICRKAPSRLIAAWAERRDVPYGI